MNLVAGYFLVLMATFLSHSILAQVSFSSSDLAGINLENPTTLQFGPDGRLYVGQQDGTIFAYSIQKVAPNNYQVVNTEVILQIKQIPNHNDDGSLNTSITDRQVTGLLVTGTSSKPILYVSSSDPRIGAGPSGEDINLDTNSGIISKLTWNGSNWDKKDLVRGLPRSEENHSSNGMQLDEFNNILYLAQGGHTNAGSPSNNFSFSSEYALSGAILKIDLNAIEQNYGGTYDLPTLDDPQRSNSGPGGSDINDPFGGNDGLNQAKLIPGSPVQIHSPGYRNIYDLVLTKTSGVEGRLYTIDNGANSGWGGHPENEGTANVTNNYVDGEPGSTGPGPNDAKVNNLDNLHYVSGPGFGPIYGGHPNPIRANPAGAGLYYQNDAGLGIFDLNPTADWPPVPVNMANTVESDFQNPGVDDGALYTWGSSTNGLTEYTATNYFGGALTGDLITASFDGKLYRIGLKPDGKSVASVSVFASGFGSVPLDVTAQGTGKIFEGTVWAVTYVSDKITVFEPDSPPDNSPPTASFSATPLSGEAPLSVTLDASGSSDPDGSIVSYSWDFGNGTNGTGITSNVTYNNAGSYDITLQVTDDKGAQDTYSQTITVDQPNQPPIANFTFSPASGKAPLVVSVDASSSEDPDGNISSYQWDFGNGTTGTGSIATTTYNSVGNYTILLTITDNDGATSTSSANIQVTTVNQAPISDFTMSPTSGEAPLTVNLDGSSSNDPDGSIIGYQWDFGDGSSATGKTTSKIFNNAGTFTVTLTVTDDNGEWSSSSKDVNVNSPNISPLASFTANLTAGEAPLTVAVDASLSSDPDGEIVGYMWDFGNGVTDNKKASSVTYQNPGTYTIKLTVTDNYGGTGTISLKIEVSAPNQPPEPKINANTSSGAAPLTISLDGTASSDPDGTIENYEWDFGNGTGNTGATTSVTYSTEGTYTVTLTTTDDEGASATTSLEITVSKANQSPVAEFTTSAKAGVAPFTIALDATASNDPDGTIQSFNWDFGNGETATGITTTVTYQNPGTYTVTLTVVDNDGGNSSTNVQITVTLTNQSPVASFTASPESGESPLIVTLDASGSIDYDGNITSYNWDFGNGNFGMGKTVYIVFSKPGNFTVQLIVIDNEGALSVSSKEIKVVDLILSTNEDDLSANFELYPNPLTDQVIVKCKEPVAKLDISIKSISGQLIMQRQLTQIVESQEIHIQVPQLSQGTYIVTIQTEKQTQNYRLIKQ